MSAYENLFSRNYGVFTQSEQERIRAAHILIIGCGGIGGTVALCLARSGVEHFTLVEFDVYEASNMNRQIACFSSTLGCNKAEVIAEQIRQVNPQAEVTVFPRLLSLEEVDGLIRTVDLVFPAADDFAFSQMCFRQAQQAGKPALYVMPSGLWAHVALVLPSSPLVEEIIGIPVFQDYEEIKRFYQSPVFRKNSAWYMRHAGWQPGYWQAFAQGEQPSAQVCPLVWLASSLGALQVIKWLAGRKRPVAFPYVWWVSDSDIRVANLRLPNLPAFWRLSRKLYWRWLKVGNQRSLR